MTLLTEIIEIFAAIGPAIIAVGLSTRRATHAWSWFVIVLGSAFLAVVSLGLLLSRLVAKCGEQVPSCEAGLVAKPRVSGIFARCYTCESVQDSMQLAATLNGWLIPSHACSAVVCLLASAIATIRFIFWTKRVLGSPSNG